MAETSMERARSLVGATRAGADTETNEANVVCIGCGARWALGSKGSAFRCPECGKGSLRVVKEASA